MGLEGVDGVCAVGTDAERAGLDAHGDGGSQAEFNGDEFSPVDMASAGAPALFEFPGAPLGFGEEADAGVGGIYDDFGDVG